MSFCTKLWNGIITYNSSMVSCGGRGSSKPSPIISHVNVLSSMPIPIFISAAKFRSFKGGWGDSPLNPQRSAFTPSTMVMDGFETLKSPAGTGLRLIPLTPPWPAVKVVGVTSAAAAAAGSWVFSKVSTCSIEEMY